MARTTGRSGFKMKQSPTKGKLQDFFNNLGANLKRNRKDIGEESDRKYGHGKYKGSIDPNDGVYTDWDRNSERHNKGKSGYDMSGKVNTPRQKSGESKFQYDVRMRKYNKKRSSHNNRNNLT
tara:strand:+ start:239 stop:604 length:366 start_codon:yes stop_codon:yes gene_type:complete